MVKMKLAKELIGLMSDYYNVNKLWFKLFTPPYDDYLKVFQTTSLTRYLSAYGYLPGTQDFTIEVAMVPTELLTKVDLTIKGALFLYLNEILSWNEVKVLLNIDSTGVALYKGEGDTDPGAYDIVISLLAVLFGKVKYTTAAPLTYSFKRLTMDVYYWDQPTYYYGYKAALSYSTLNDLLDNIDWFISENPEVQTNGTPNKYDVLGMLRINNKLCKTIIDESTLDPVIKSATKTELDDLGLYNVALNLIRLSDDTFGLNNVLFDFYKGIKETTQYSDDGVTYQTISWADISSYSKYVDTIYGVPVNGLDANYLEIEKTGNIIRNIQNFLIH